MKIADEMIMPVRQKFAAVYDCLTEKGRRLWTAAEAISYGHGGVQLVSKATNVSRTTIHLGIKEIHNKPNINKQGIRKKGGGRKKLKETQSDLINNLNRLKPELNDPSGSLCPQTMSVGTSRWPLAISARRSSLSA